MSIVYNGTGMEQFFSYINQPFRTEEQFAELIRKAIACVADELLIGRAELTWDAPTSNLYPGGKKIQVVLYENGGSVAKHYETRTYHTGEGGTIVLLFYPCEGALWHEEEIQAITSLCNQIYLVGSRFMMQDVIRRMMTLDINTGVPNLSGYMEHAGRLLAMKQLDQYYAFFYNVRNFRFVNKVFPTTEGDKVLKSYAQRVFQFIDGHGYMGRPGGDNFVVLIEEGFVGEFLNFIQQVEISHEYEGRVQKFTFGATMGGSLLHGIRNVGEIMSRTTVAYQAARQRKTNVTYYSDEIYRSSLQQKDVLMQFPKALEHKEFLVYYQPKVKVTNREICGAEALVRWMHDGRLISPAEFIPVLERDGSICRLDFYVLEEVCRFIQKRMQEGKESICISVNFSRRHIQNPQLVDAIVEIIDRYQVPHDCIEIELTETEDFRDYTQMSQLVANLRGNRINTSIDDFGTGYSSLSMLRRTGLDLVKIDRSFIPLEKDYPEKQKDLIMFRHIVEIAKELGMHTVAEGVETESQLEYLVHVGCDIVQGYVFDRPLPEEDFISRLNRKFY